MKKIYVLFLIITIIMFINSCSDDNNKKDDLDIRVEKKNNEEVIQIGVLDYPPYEFIENGEITGAGVEILRIAFERMGYKYEINIYPWARLLQETKVGQIDVIVDVYHTKERGEYLIYSNEPYAIYPLTFIKRKDYKFSYNSLKELSDYSIGIIRGFYYGNKFHTMIDNKTLKIEYAKDINSNVQKLLKKRIDLVAETYYSGEVYIEKNSLQDELDIVENSFDKLTSYVCFSKANKLESLRDEYDKTIKNMRNEGIIKKIYDKYNLKYFN